MFSQFQKRKIEHHFNIIDFNQDGFLTRDDLYNHGKAYADLIKVPQEKYIAKEIEFWDKMNDILNIKQERPLTSTEHLHVFESVMLGSCFLPVFLWDYMELIWGSLKMDKKEGLPYEKFVGVMVTDKEAEAKEIFNLLDTKNNGKLYIYELYNYWLNYFYSNNQACPSKWVFGKIDI